MDRAPIGQAGMFRIVRHHAGLEPRDAGIVDDHIGDGNDAGQPRPIGLLAHVQHLEAAADLGGGRSPHRFVDIR